MTGKKLDKRITIWIITGVLASSIVVAIAASRIIPSQSLVQDSSHPNPGCMSLSDTIASAKFSIKTPSYIPAGYTFQCGQSDGRQLSFFYSNRTVDRRNFEAGNTLEEIDRGGTIAMIITDDLVLSGETKANYNDTDMIMAQVKQINEKYPALKPTIMDINGAKAFGYEATPGAGQQKAIFSDGKTIVNYYDVPARLVMYDHGILTTLDGKVPLVELEKMARSLQ